MTANLVTAAVPVGLISRSGARVTGVLITDDEIQFDACDCHGFAWGATDMAYDPGPDAYTCPLSDEDGAAS